VKVFFHVNKSAQYSIIVFITNWSLMPIGHLIYQLYRLFGSTWYFGLHSFPQMAVCVVVYNNEFSFMCMFCRSLFVLFVLFLLAIVLSVLLWFTDSDYLFGIFWSLCCLSFFDLRILITSLWHLQTPFVDSNLGNWVKFYCEGFFSC
jgi:hypothetical protein